MKTFIRLLSIASLTIALGLLSPTAQAGLDPLKKTGELIEKLDSTVKSIIEEFGDRLDASVLETLNQLRATLQSAKMMSSDLLGVAFGKLSKERADTIDEAANLISSIQASLKDVSNTSEVIEQRFSDTLERVARANKEPFLLNYTPSLFLPSSTKEVRIAVYGKHLDHVSNRLEVAGEKFRASGSGPDNKIEFSIPRNLLQINDQGYASVRLHLHHTKEYYWWQFWKWDEVVARRATLEIKSAGQNLGTYRLETEIPSGPTYSVVTKSIEKTSPVNVEECFSPPPGGEFDVGAIDLSYTQNDMHRDAFTQYAREQVTLPGFPPKTIQTTVPVSMPAVAITGPSDAATISYAEPEKLCIRFHSPTNPDAHINQTFVYVKLRYRVKLPGTATLHAVKGSISWDGDTPEILPPNHKGFRAYVTFDAERGTGKTRVFTDQSSTELLNILYDPNTRTVIFRPTFVE